MTILALLVLFISCGSKKTNNWKNVEINLSAKDSFYLAAKLVDTTGDDELQMFDGITAIVVPEKMGTDEDFSFEERAGFEMPCECVFRNDSLVVTAALAWEGGFAYTTICSRQRAINSLMLFGKDKKWILDGKEYNDEIYIPSLRNTLVISRPFPLKEEELIYGWFDIETPLFFQVLKDEKKEEQQHIIRIYFSCQVWPESAF